MKELLIISGSSGSLGDAIKGLLSRGHTDRYDVCLIHRQDLNNLSGCDLQSTRLVIQDPETEEAKRAIKELFRGEYKSFHYIALNGLLVTSPDLLTTAKQLHESYSANVVYPLSLSLALARHAAAKRLPGTLNFIGSISASKGHRGRLAYNASKASLKGIVKSLARSLGSCGIRANLISPGLIESPMLRDKSRKVSIEQEIQAISSGRLSTSDEIAGAILALISPAFAYLNGQELNIDGGMF